MIIDYIVYIILLTSIIGHSCFQISAFPDVAK